MGEERVADGYKSVTGYDRWEQICPCAMEGHEGHLDHTVHKGDGLVSDEKADQQPEGEQGGRTESTLRRKCMGCGGWSWRGSGLSHPGGASVTREQQEDGKEELFLVCPVCEAQQDEPRHCCDSAPMPCHWCVFHMAMREKQNVSSGEIKMLTFFILIRDSL